MDTERQLKRLNDLLIKHGKLNKPPDPDLTAKEKAAPAIARIESSRDRTLAALEEKRTKRIAQDHLAVEQEQTRLSRLAEESTRALKAPIPVPESHPYDPEKSLLYRSVSALFSIPGYTLYGIAEVSYHVGKLWGYAAIYTYRIGRGIANALERIGDAERAKGDSS